MRSSSSLNSNSTTTTSSKVKNSNNLSNTTTHSLNNSGNSNCNNTYNININVHVSGLFPRFDRPLQSYQDFFLSQANLYRNALQQQSLGMYHGYCSRSHQSLGSIMHYGQANHFTILFYLLLL